MFSITLPSMVYFYDIVEGVVVKESKPGVTELITLENIGFYTLIVAAFSFGQVRSCANPRPLVSPSHAGLTRPARLKPRCAGHCKPAVWVVVQPQRRQVAVHARAPVPDQRLCAVRTLRGQGPCVLRILASQQQQLTHHAYLFSVGRWSSVPSSGCWRLPASSLAWVQEHQPLREHTWAPPPTWRTARARWPSLQVRSRVLERSLFSALPPAPSPSPAPRPQLCARPCPDTPSQAHKPSAWWADLRLRLRSPASTPTSGAASTLTSTPPRATSRPSSA